MTSTPRMATAARRSLWRTIGRGFRATRRALRVPPRPQPRTNTKQFPYSGIWNLQFVERGRFIRSGPFLFVERTLSLHLSNTFVVVGYQPYQPASRFATMPSELPLLYALRS